MDRKRGQRKGATSKNVKKCQTYFRRFSCRAKKKSKIVEKCQNNFRHFSTILARHQFSCPFWGALTKEFCSGGAASHCWPDFSHYTEGCFRSLPRSPITEASTGEPMPNHLQTLCSRSLQISEVSKRGWREGVGDRQRNPHTTPTKLEINIASAHLGVVRILPFS